MRDTMLTTFDNPHDPFKEFASWKKFDEEKGYFTCEYLARIVKSSDELSETDEALSIEEAIDEIITENILGMYKKVIA